MAGYTGWRKSTRSSDSANDNCVECRQSWRKSTRSNNSGNDQCVEARSICTGYQVRDSKLGDDSPVFDLAATDFAGLLRATRLAPRTEGQGRLLNGGRPSSCFPYRHCRARSRRGSCQIRSAARRPVRMRVPSRITKLLPERLAFRRPAGSFGAWALSRSMVSCTRRAAVAREIPKPEASWS
nr:DUF397 domain-containing protein [Glycomyces sp. NRRL B-16210]